MSGHYSGLLIGFGVASCLLCSWLALRIGALDDEGLPMHLFARLPGYLLWLFREIINSNIATGKIILSRSADPGNVFGGCPSNHRCRVGQLCQFNNPDLRYRDR